MKSSIKSSIIAGIGILLLAAFFSISLITRALDFGVSGPGHNNIFFMLGDMLYSVYGFSSILIPGFLIVCGLCCFSQNWTSRKTLRLLTAIIPFFTAVITESICRSIVTTGSARFMGTKITATVISGLMLMIIEVIGAGLLADRLDTGAGRKNSGSSRKLPVLKFNDGTENVDGDSGDENSAETEPQHKSADGTEIQDTHTGAGTEPSQKEFTEEETSAAMENVAGHAEEDAQENPATVITQEEFDALISSPADDAAEELEWSDLPPQPESLPPEYTEEEEPGSTDFPVEEFEAGNSQTEFSGADEPVEEENWPGSGITAENTESEIPEYEHEDESGDSGAARFPQETEFQDKAERQETEEIHEDSPFDVQIYTPESSPEQNDDAPYSDARYIDSVIAENPYPRGIELPHEEASPDGEEFPQDDSESAEKKSPYPSGIRLSDAEADGIRYGENSSGQEEPPYYSGLEFPEQNTENQALDPDFFDIDITEDDGTQDDPGLTASDFPDDADSPEKKTEFSAEPVQPEPEIKIPKRWEKILHPQQEQKTGETARPEKKTESPGPALTNAAAEVFSQMEADIRRSHGLPEIPEQEIQKPEEELPEEGIQDEAAEPEQDTSQSVTPEQTAAAPTVLTAVESENPVNRRPQEELPEEAERIPRQTAPEAESARAVRKGPYIIPAELLTEYENNRYWIIDEKTKEASVRLRQTLKEFNIEAQIIGIKKGPVVTMFEILPAPGVKLSKIVALQDNIALSLAASSVRIVAPIPGKQAVGIEVPNRERSIVGFREIIEQDLPEYKKMAVPVVLGKDILGKPQLIDLVKTPHMLIAGATGSGKSVCVNSIILSILYKRSFRDVKLILIDPKVVELKLYNNIPHLLTPVITEPKRAFQALQYCLCEMERRYALLDSLGVRDISNYNQRIKERGICTEKLPYIVVIIDEFADLMATTGKELESIVARLAAMSRAVGIHLVLATQRPSVNVITGLIKANIPTRIAFMVASRTDSHIIIDSIGAEKLLGRGDMLYASAVDPFPVRIQGTFVSDQEVEKVVEYVKTFGEPDYIDDEIFIEDDDDSGVDDDPYGNSYGEDPLYDQALEIVVQAGKASASYIQRRLKIGYNRAARLVEEMEERGIVGPANGSKPREIIHIP